MLPRPLLAAGAAAAALTRCWFMVMRDGQLLWLRARAWAASSSATARAGRAAATRWNATRACYSRKKAAAASAFGITWKGGADVLCGAAAKEPARCAARLMYNAYQGAMRTPIKTRGWNMLEASCSQWGKQPGSSSAAGLMQPPGHHHRGSGYTGCAGDAHSQPS